MITFKCKSGAAYVFRGESIGPRINTGSVESYILETVCLEYKNHDVVVLIDEYRLTQFKKAGEYKFSSFPEVGDPAFVPDERAIIEWWEEKGCPLDAREEESDLEMSYEEIAAALKSLPRGKLENFTDSYSFNKGVNAGGWGTYTKVAFIEGDETEGVLELHTTGVHPRVNKPHVRVDFKRNSKVSNGYMLPSKEFFEEILKKYNFRGALKVYQNSEDTIWVKGNFICFRPEIVKLINEKGSDFSTPKKVNSILKEVYGEDEKSLFVEILIQKWVEALSS